MTPETDKIVDYDARPYPRDGVIESSEIIIGAMEINKDNQRISVLFH